MEQEIRAAVEEKLEELGAGAVPFGVERTTDLAHGDYAVNAAMAAAKLLGKNPRELGEEIAAALRESLGDRVSAVEVAGPGFVNVTLSAKTIDAKLHDAVAHADSWGTHNAQKGQRVMVEYTDPNPFKEMHIGHLMSNTIGEAVSRLIAATGATLTRASYQGDVGPHVAKAIWGLQQKGITEPADAGEIGAAYAHGARSYEESTEVKAEIDAINRAIYAGEDHALMELWRKGREVSLAAFEDLYRILGTKFDYYFFESEVATAGTELVRDGVGRGVFEESQGAVIYPGEKKGLHTLVFITSQNTPTYEAKEIGLAFEKENRWPSDRSIILTAAEQIGHFKVVLAALEDIAPKLGEKTSHIPHGFLRLTSGKMSSRDGNVVTLAGLIKDVIEKAMEKNEDPLIAKQVAIGAIKYMILRQAPGGDIIFDFEKSLSLEGDSGPYLQYATVRAKSVLASAAEKGIVIGKEDGPAVPYEIARLLARYPEVVVRASAELAPQYIAQYLTQLAGSWNAFYAKERIIGGEYESYKLGLAQAFVHTMTAGLNLLAIPVPEKM